MQCEGFDRDWGGGEGFGVGEKDEEDDFGSSRQSEGEGMGGRACEQAGAIVCVPLTARLGGTRRSKNSGGRWNPSLHKQSAERLWPYLLKNLLLVSFESHTFYFMLNIVSGSSADSSWP